MSERAGECSRVRNKKRTFLLPGLVERLLSRGSYQLSDGISTSSWQDLLDVIDERCITCGEGGGGDDAKVLAAGQAKAHVTSRRLLQLEDVPLTSWNR